MEGFYGVMHGLAIAIQPMHVLYTLIGVFIGTMISHLPGIGPSAGIALLIPVTFGMDPPTALMMLIGIYYGCMYGGAVTAILLNTPGDAAAVMTVLDGYPLARQGRAAATLAIAAVSSFIAGIMGVTALSFIALPLASVKIPGAVAVTVKLCVVTCPLLLMLTVADPLFTSYGICKFTRPELT